MTLALYGAATAAFCDCPHLMTANQLGLYLGLKRHDLFADLSFGAAKRRQLISQPAAFCLPEAYCILAVATVQFGRAPFNVSGA
jgi:hypothetical protein